MNINNLLNKSMAYGVRAEYITISAAALLAFAASTVHAGSIMIEDFSVSTFEFLTNDAAWVVEDFETGSELTDLGNGSTSPIGTLLGNLESSKVGAFSAISSSPGGNGTTCNSNGSGPNGCTTLSRTFGAVNGQGNLAPGNGGYSLNSNDTLGVNWAVELAGSRKFNEVLFAIQDPSDNGAVVTISGAGAMASGVFNGAGNGDSFIVRVLFDSAVSAADISIRNSKTNDAFSLDGASVSAVPLPAAVWLFVSALVGMGFIGRRKMKVEMNRGFKT